MYKHAKTRLLGVLLGVAAACALDDELENADCESNADCWTNQTCVHTSLQRELGVYGLCRPGGNCLRGEQLGCACAIDELGARVCTGGLVLSSDDEACQCVGEAATT
jgi:hypothetical protein